MSTEANQVSYKKIEIKESTASTTFYGLMLIPWFYVAVITLRNWFNLHNAGDHHFKLFLLRITLIGIFIISVVIMFKFTVAAKSLLNKTCGPRTFWEPPLLGIEITIMRSPYTIGRNFDRERKVPEPDIAGAFAGLSCLAVVACSVLNWLPEHSVLGLTRLGLAIVFFLAAVLMFYLLYNCQEYDFSD